MPLQLTMTTHPLSGRQTSDETAGGPRGLRRGCVAPLSMFPLTLALLSAFARTLQPAIRTNTTYCIAKIAKQLRLVVSIIVWIFDGCKHITRLLCSESSRAKLLLPSFTRYLIRWLSLLARRSCIHARTLARRALRDKFAPTRIAALAAFVVTAPDHRLRVCLRFPYVRTGCCRLPWICTLWVCLGGRYCLLLRRSLWTPCLR